MTLVQNVVLFPLHRWLDQRDTWRLLFCLTVAGFFGLSTGFDPAFMLPSMTIIAYVMFTRWAWITNRLR